MDATLERGWKMEKVEVKRDDLRERVEENLKKHRQDYIEAVAGYKQECLKQLDQLRQKVEANMAEDRPMVPLLLHLEMPVSHEADYEQIIEMLRMEQRTIFEIQTDKFACYVMDRWKWKDAFVGTANRYTGKGAF